VSKSALYPVAGRVGIARKVQLREELSVKFGIEHAGIGQEISAGTCRHLVVEGQGNKTRLLRRPGRPAIEQDQKERNRQPR
jgi:hypothetical protein